MECSFSNYSSIITCAVNFNIKPSSQICYFHSCFDNIDTHLSQNRINPSSVCSELQLIKFRAGLFDQDTEQFTICPNHRYHLGKGWKPSTLCMLKAPLQICNGKRKTERATVTVQQSRVLREKFGILIPVGAGVCRKCRSDMIHITLEEKSPQYLPVNENSVDYTISTVEVETTPRQLSDGLFHQGNEYSRDAEDTTTSSYTLETTHRQLSDGLFHRGNEYSRDEEDTTTSSYTLETTHRQLSDGLFHRGNEYSRDEEDTTTSSYTLETTHRQLSDGLFHRGNEYSRDEEDTTTSSYTLETTHRQLSDGLFHRGNEYSRDEEDTTTSSYTLETTHRQLSDGLFHRGNEYSRDEEDTTTSSYTLRARPNKISCDLSVDFKEEDTASCSTQMLNADSQGSIWLPNSQDTYTSDQTEGSIPQNDNTCMMKRRALDNFLQSCGLSPVKKQLKTTWDESSERTKHDYSMKAKQIFEQVVNVLAPGQGSQLLDSLMNTCSSTSSDKTLEILATTYHLSSDWGTQRQILSVFSNSFTFKELNAYIPNLTRYRYTAARKHALASGQGQPVQISSYTREGLSEQQIKCFIDFVMSPNVMTDSPFLETKLKLANGEVYQVPQIILNSVRSRVVEQYKTFCQQSGINNVASDRSYMRILEAIKPNIRKSMKGLDNYPAEGAKAIDDLKKIANVLGKQLKGKEWEDDISQRLSDCKQYLKLDYKMHILLESEIPDHCCQYALSSESREHSVVCSHSHNTACSSCNEFYQVIEGIKQVAGEVEFENEDQKDDIQYTLSQSVKALEEWKKHLLRSVNQDAARSDVIENLSDGDVLIERDWAMKLLPMMYRESQSKWFAKRGLNWHITVGTYKKGDDIHSHTIVHIFDNASQDASTSNAILKDSVARLKVKNHSLIRGFVRSDNAGCFHSVEAIFCIPFLNQENNLKVTQVDFADPQGGKSICDRRAAHIKGSIRNFVNEGNNVTSANEFLNAVIKSNIKNVEVVTAIPPCGIVVKKAVKVKDITTLNNFQYHDDHVLAFKQYKIGNGVKIVNRTFQVYDNFPTITIMKSSSTDEVVKGSKPSVISEPTVEGCHAVSNRICNKNDVNTTPIEDAIDNSAFVFTCPEPNCLLTFMKYGNLTNHLDKGDHQFKKDIKSLSDKAKLEYVQQIDTKQSMLVKSSVNTSSECSTLTRGWALKSKRSVKRFTNEQTGFLKEMFEKGEMTGHKYDPEEVSVMMRTIKKDGKRRFSKDEFLTPSQISSFFSRL